MVHKGLKFVKVDYSINELIRYGRMLGYNISAAKGKGLYRAEGVKGVFTKNLLIRSIIFMEML